MNKHSLRRQSDQLIGYLNNMASRMNLSLSSQVILAGAVVGIDGIQKKLLAVRDEYGSIEHQLIDLNKVQACSVHKKYSPFLAGASDSKNTDSYVERVGLRFMMNNGRDILVSFYTRGIDSLSELKALESKTSDWGAMFTKMLVREKIA